MGGLRRPYQGLLVSLGMILVGAILTAGGYLWAAMSEGGGRYLIFTGLMFWGAIRTLTSLPDVVKYHAAKRSSDPWKAAAYVPEQLDQLAARSINSQDPTERTKALYSLPALTTRYSAEDLSRGFVSGLTDQVRDVQSAAYQSLLVLSQQNSASGAAVVRGMLQRFGQDQGLVSYVPGGADTLHRFNYITSDSKLFSAWATSGTLPELPPGPTR